MLDFLFSYMGLAVTLVFATVFKTLLAFPTDKTVWVSVLSRFSTFTYPIVRNGFLGKMDKTALVRFVKPCGNFTLNRLY